jgi:hypothetical protein
MIEQALPVRKRAGETTRRLGLKALAAQWAVTIPFP